MTAQKKCVIIYDGVCHLCNWWVRFLIRRDNNDQFRFLQFQHVPEGVIPETVEKKASESVIVRFRNQYFTESDAVFVVLNLLPAPWRQLRFFRYFPRVIRDVVYRLIARNRYQVFGKYDECPLVPKEWRHKFPADETLNDLLT